METETGLTVYRDNICSKVGVVKSYKARVFTRIRLTLLNLNGTNRKNQLDDDDDEDEIFFFFFDNKGRVDYKCPLDCTYLRKYHFDFLAAVAALKYMKPCVIVSPLDYNVSPRRNVSSNQ
jgi:hypothetical protein